MAKCKNCRNLTFVEEYGEKYPWCDMLDDCPNIEFERDCPKFERMSNADAIRNMSDEELAIENLYFISECALKEGFHYAGLDGNYYKTGEDAFMANMRWLKSEIKE